MSMNFQSQMLVGLYLISKLSAVKFNVLNLNTSFFIIIVQKFHKYKCVLIIILSL